MEEDGVEDIQLFETPDEAFTHLRLVGTQDDADIDLAEAALALALVFLPGVHIDRYRQHFKKLAAHAQDEFESRLRLKEDDTVALRARTLRKIIHEAHGYNGDEKNYDDIQNASMIRVIERRAGLPVALGLIYLIVARRVGWHADGLSFPGHFILRLEREGERVIIDPFQGGRDMQAADLRLLLKSVAGTGAELSHNYYDAVGNRDILLRLQNNLKKRLIDLEDYAQAIRVLETMAAIAPHDVRPLFDTGVLYAKLGQNQQAATALEDYIARAKDPRDRQQAQSILAQIKGRG